MTFPSNLFSLEPAAPADLLALLALYDAAARWLQAAHIPQWPVPFPVELLADGVEKREIYVKRENKTLIAALALRENDAEFWGETGNDNRALYVHRLVVSRENAEKTSASKS